jgi:GT2 family glycosyltransferase
VRVDGKFFARDGQRFRVQGVTYGPFSPLFEEPFPAPERVRQDFAQMQTFGVQSVRTYHVPPDWLLHVADEHNLTVFLDIPWRKHLCFLESSEAMAEARAEVQQAAERGRRHACVFAYSIGNEIPPAIVRWHGPRRVQRFLAELRDVAKQADPDGLVTYANYPSTEYLDLPFLDFATFNVYLHNRQTFARYLLRLQNLVSDRPLVLGELGMDTLRNGEDCQAVHLQQHLREALLLGAAGAFVFSWTDEWHTGGHPIEDWAFGITRADRSPKPACQVLQELFQRAPVDLLAKMPRVSVVVCSYNGAATLEACLDSLRKLDYPDYEVIVVDDGSTDATSTILARFPEIRALRQPNRGLSAARNAGLHAATGSIVAYTDSDCVVDPDWLTQLVYQLERTSAHAVGGPNLSPEDGRLAACVAASPGQPMHVLESDQVAEHIPGCNMAFRREVLLAINGFDTQYRKAGDDVDVCWRLQQAGMWITFAPGAFVWHHRRQTPRAYLRQQAGYGEAEALLEFKHPDRFNRRGASKWQGALYGASLQGVRLGGPIIYHGTFGTGLFQCIYRAGPAHWAMLPSTLEWHLAAGLSALGAVFWPWLWILTGAMLLLSLSVAALQAAQATLAPTHRGLASRLLITALCYAQPLVRSWWRYWTRLFSYCHPIVSPGDLEERGLHFPLRGKVHLSYWTEEGADRAEILGLFIAHLMEHRWGTTVDSGWSRWDVVIHSHPWTVLHVLTTQEDHGSKKRMLRVRYEMRPSGLLVVAGLMGAAVTSVTALLHGWGAVLPLAGLVVFCLGVWCRGTQRAAQAVAVFDSLARSLGFFRCSPHNRVEAAPTGGPAEENLHKPEAPSKQCMPSLALQACAEQAAPPTFVSEKD